jgi:ABC-2 type transport system permease protein
MNTTLSIARKELRAFFQSSVALIFLGIFLLVTLFSFFSTYKFFARNLADVRPLFESLPLLLILLVAAITMRSWAEERRAGTLEILLTLPLRTGHLVLGKFLAGMALVGIALLLTLPLPLMVSFIGPLDWGPVIGGYVGAMLLGAAYMAIGLCVSARTDNQVVALMVTLVLGGVLYLIGDSSFTSLFSQGTTEFLNNMSTSSRFESIERGVLDLRDLVYYASIGVFFLMLNVTFLAQQRLDTGLSELGRQRNRMLLTTVALVGLNVLAANAWLAPISRARLDLTANQVYSVSEVTKRTLGQLTEPLALHGYFSERTHPLLSPLVPTIRDLLSEYEIHGNDRVNVQILDPSTDDELEQEIGEAYGIRSFPFGVSDRHSQAVVNAYFHILIRYGDKYEVLDFQDLIEVHADAEDIQVELRNLEYDLTRTIKKVSQEFQSLDVILAQLPGSARMTAYMTPDQVPENFAESVQVIRDVGAELAAASNGKLVFAEVDPSTDRDLQLKLHQEYGVRPISKDLFGTQVFYMHVVLEIGDNVERILPRGKLTAADLKKAIEAAVKRATPGQLKTVGIFTEKPESPPPNPNIPPQFQPPPPQPDYRGLQQVLTENYQVEMLELTDGYVPDEIDVLVVGKTGRMTDEQTFAIDQFLMRGGSVIALAGAYRVDAGRRTGLSARVDDGNLFELLETWGIEVHQSMVMDPTRNAMFPIPVTERRGGFQLQRIKLEPYPLFPDIRRQGFAPNHPALAGITNVTMPWSSALELTVAEEEGAPTVEVLLRSSSDAWENTSGEISTNLTRGSEETKERVLAATLSGRFTSHFSDKKNPLFGSAEDDGTGRTLTESVADGRLVVFGSSEMVSDLLMQLSQQPSGAVHRGNLTLLRNAIDWSVADTDLLSIRSGSAFTRTLDPMEATKRSQLELVTYAAVLIPMFLIVLIPLTRVRRITAIPIKSVERS